MPLTVRQLTPNTALLPSPARVPPPVRRAACTTSLIHRRQHRGMFNTELTYLIALSGPFTNVSYMNYVKLYTKKQLVRDFSLFTQIKYIHITQMEKGKTLC